jgi:RNA polymerase sigma factor (sigma-70 family)
MSSNERNRQEPRSTFTDEQLGKIQEWERDDPCFAYVNRLRIACLLGDAEVLEVTRSQFDQHYSACKSCWGNLLLEADRTGDRFKSWIYYEVSLRAQLEFMKVGGGNYYIEEIAGGVHIQFTLPNDTGDPWSGMELILSHRPAMGSVLILDLNDGGDFENPARVLDRLDRLQAGHAREFGAPGSESIQWWSIVLDHDAEVQVRWEGRVKRIARSATLHGRYTKLVRFIEGEYPSGEEESEQDLSRECLKVRDLALEYNGTMPFAGFARTRMKQRAVDAYRTKQRDGAHPRRRDQNPEQQKGQEDQPDDATESLEDPASGAAVAGLEEHLRVEGLFKALEALLTDRERRVVALLRTGATQAHISKELGVWPRTVNKDIAKIREKAAQILASEF